MLSIRKLTYILLALQLLLGSCSSLKDTHHEERTPSTFNASEFAADLLDPEFFASTKNELQIMQFNLLRILLDATFENEELKLSRARLAREYWYQTSSKIVRNYLAAKNGEAKPFEIAHPPAWTLRSEVDYLAQGVSLDSQRIPVEMIDIGRSLFKVIDLESLPFQLLPAEINREDLAVFLKKLQQAASDEEQLLLFMSRFEGEVAHYFERVKNIGTELAAHPDIDLGDEEAQKFLRLFLDHYFQNVDEGVLKTIMFEVMLLGHEPTPLEGARIMFRNSGPGLGKGLQQLGKEPTMGKSLAAVLETLEDAGKEVPYYMVEEILTEDPGGRVFQEIAPKALGTGTMAQVQKAMLEHEGALVPVAVRFFKPGIEERAADDIRILSSFVTRLKNENLIGPEMIPQAEKLVNSLKDFLFQELKLESTMSHQRRASEVYHKTMETLVAGKKYEVEFIVPKLYETSSQASKLHVQEFLPPRTKFTQVRSRAHREAISSTLFELFFREALFGSGFMHADLHQGNFSVLEAKGNKIKVAIYDYGMAHQLSRQARRSFLLIGAGAELGDAELLAAGMKGFQKSVKKAELKKLRQLIKSEMAASAPKEAEDWVLWGLRGGHIEGEELGTMARGSLLIWQLPKSVGTSAQMEDLLEEIVQAEVMRSAGKADFPLTLADRVSLVSKAVRGSCFEAIKRFFRLGRK